MEEDRKVCIRIIRSNRKTLSLEIKRDGQVLVRAPLWMPDKDISNFVQEKTQWIREHLEQVKEEPLNPNERLSDEEIKALAEQALIVIPERVRYYAPLVGVTYGRITIRNQKSRWGSCSANGNLNFNCLLMLTPPEVIDYVVVHELCHRKEMNHSPRFWAEVERILPDYKIRRKWLKEHGHALISRM